MSIIIDANRAGDFSIPVSGHAAEILRCVTRRQNKIAVGGKLYRELAKTSLGPRLLEFRRAGLLKIADDSSVDALEERLKAKTKSNDAHVVALLLVSDTRLVYTEDDDLIDDIKNKDLVHPRGKVVRRSTSHRQVCALLRHFAE